MLMIFGFLLNIENTIAIFFLFHPLGPVPSKMMRSLWILCFNLPQQYTDLTHQIWRFLVYMFLALYYSQAQLETCRPSSQNKWSVDVWMCCQITTPWLINTKTLKTSNFRNRKIPRFDRNNPIVSWGQKHLFC